MSEILVETFKSIELERPYFNKSFVLLRQLIEEYGTKDIFERLYDDISLGKDIEPIIELFELLYHNNMTDGGNEARGTTTRWLEGNDVRKIAIARAFNASLTAQP